MPLLHCNLCHGEWEGEKNSVCYDCGAGGYILEEETTFEKCVKDLKSMVKEMEDHARKEGSFDPRVHLMCSRTLPDE